MTVPQPSAKPTNIELTCTEISGLWSVYMQESLSVCFLTYLLHHLQNERIIPIAKEALQIAQGRLDKIKQVLQAENFPVPAGFSEGDVNLTAPALFHDTFTISYVYMVNRLSMVQFAFIASNNVRLDVLDFFNECVHSATEMFGKAVRLMLEMGIYDRPPMLNYPRKIEYVQKSSFLSGMLGKKRPLSAVELSEIFFNIERNYFSVLVMLGFAQVVEDRQVKEHILRGKYLSEKQIELFNGLLMEEEMLGTVPVSMEVTASTVAPFSDKLIMAMINMLNSVDIVLISHALALSMRSDLVAAYTKIVAEVMLYAKDTFDLAVEHQWLEQPPLAVDRQQLIHS